jgi:hypothetical protein
VAIQTNDQLSWSPRVSDHANVGHVDLGLGDRRGSILSASSGSAIAAEWP